MHDVRDSLLSWWNEGRPTALATVVATFNSAPRSAGATMLVDPDGAAVGSVSGGCVEGAVYEVAQEVLQSGIPRLERYGVSDNDAFSVGLTCGGTLDIFVERVSPQDFPELQSVWKDIDTDQPVALATVVEHPDSDRIGRHLIVRANSQEGSLGSSHSDAAISDDARGLLVSGRNAILEYGPEGERRGQGQRVFVTSYMPPPRMLIFGAIDFAAAMARMGNFLGYHVTVCDARPIFATKTRFPEVDDVVVSWPHEYLEQEIHAGRTDNRTAVCVLTHDPKFDVPVLELALQHDLEYVGAMGSRRTHEDRLERLQSAGVTDDQLQRLSSPIGLDLGSRTPEETAVSIAAEIIAQRWGHGGSRLSHTAGPIHK